MNLEQKQMEKEVRDTILEIIKVFKKENNEYKNIYKKSNKYCVLFQLYYTLLLKGLETKKLNEQRLDKLLYEILEYIEKHMDNCYCIEKCNENFYLKDSEILKKSNELKDEVKKYIK